YALARRKRQSSRLLQRQTAGSCACLFSDAKLAEQRRMRTMSAQWLIVPKPQGKLGEGRARMANDSTSPLATYNAHLEKGELAYQFSPAANRAVFFPRVLCPYTGSDKLEWRVSRGAGTVYATTVVHPAEGAPYNVALIDCDEGFRLMSRIEDVPADQVKIGMRVKFRVHHPGGE